MVFEIVELFMLGGCLLRGGGDARAGAFLLCVLCKVLSFLPSSFSCAMCPIIGHAQSGVAGDERRRVCGGEVGRHGEFEPKADNPVQQNKERSNHKN